MKATNTLLDDAVDKQVKCYRQVQKIVEDRLSKLVIICYLIGIKKKKGREKLLVLME